MTLNVVSHVLQHVLGGAEMHAFQLVEMYVRAVPLYVILHANQNVKTILVWHV